MEGWIKLHRSVLDSELWIDEKFTRGQAWVDLLLLASHKETSFRKRGIKVYLKRGQVGKSLDELSKRWKWSIGKVKRFLIELENEMQIIVDNNNVNQVITIINYSKYQGDSNANNIANDNTDSVTDDNANETQIEPQTEMQTETLTETYKNDKKIFSTPACTREDETDLENCYAALSNNAIWFEPFCMNNRLTPEQFRQYLKCFFIELQNRGETTKSEKDAKHHFASWFNLNKNKLNGTDQKLSKEDKARRLFDEYEAVRGGRRPFSNDEVLPDL